MFEKKEIAEEVKEDALINELCEHLRQMGINATVVESESPEAIGRLVTFALGNVKVEGRNLDLVQVGKISATARDKEDGGYGERSGQKLQPGESGYTRERGQGSIKYDYHYVVRAKVASLERKLKAEFKPIEKRKGFFGKEVVGFQWEGGDLAQRLNSDADLKNMLLKEKIQRLLIKPEKEHQCVRITPPTGGETFSFDFGRHPAILGRKAFPTREAFDIYDRIAHHIRSIAKAG
jgi:hypothetical protein